MGMVGLILVTQRSQQTPSKSSYLLLPRPSTINQPQGKAKMSHLANALATISQLWLTSASSAIPSELQDSIRFYSARLTQQAGILLRLPQDITAQANVLLFRYWLADDLTAHEFSVRLTLLFSPAQLQTGPNQAQDVSAATIYLTAKVSASPRSLRSITNVYAYLLSAASPLSSDSSTGAADPESYYLSESAYIEFRSRLLDIEGQILSALGFNTHVALPHPLAITYLQALDAFSPANNAGNKNTGKEVGKRAIQYLNTALLSPQMLYLTHQPSALATAAVYLAAREKGVKLPESEWWEVFDCEREELGFLAVGMGSVEAVARRGVERWGGKGMVTRQDVNAEMRRMIENEEGLEDDEAQVARILEDKFGWYPSHLIQGWMKE